jgi:hypothetical protein
LENTFYATQEVGKHNALSGNTATGRSKRERESFIKVPMFQKRRRRRRFSSCTPYCTFGLLVIPLTHVPASRPLVIPLTHVPASRPRCSCSRGYKARTKPSEPTPHTAFGGRPAKGKKKEKIRGEISV